MSRVRIPSPALSDFRRIARKSGNLLDSSAAPKNRFYTLKVCSCRVPELSLVKRPPVYRRHSTWNRGYCRDRGKMTYFPGPFDSAESRVAYEKFETAWRKRHNPARDSVTLGDLALEYMGQHVPDYYRKQGQPTRQVGNIRAALRLLLSTHRGTPLCEFDGPALADFRDSLIGKRDARCKHKEKSLSRQYAALLRSFSILPSRQLRCVRRMCCSSGMIAKHMSRRPAIPTSIVRL
jgi:hypothetical protein